MGWNINPFNSGNPMSLKDAVKLSLVLALVFWIVTFFTGLTVTQIRAEPLEVLLTATQAFVVSWATNFITLAGLEQYLKSKE